MFKEKMWGGKELKVKRKLRYYKEVIDPNLQDKKYLYVLTSLKKKINIAKIRTYSTIPKTQHVETIFCLCETMSIEDESHFLLECLVYPHIKWLFHNHIPP